MRMAAEHRRSPVGAFFIQEHNINKRRDFFCRNHALRKHKILWLARYRPQDETGGKGHGTVIAIPIDSIERKPGESVDAAVARVTCSLTGNKAGSITAVRTIIGGRPRQLVCAYAPAQGVFRPAFFRNGLAPHLTSNTLLALDANCVPDVVLDTQRPGATWHHPRASSLKMLGLSLWEGRLPGQKTIENEDSGSHCSYGREKYRVSLPKSIEGV